MFKNIIIFLLNILPATIFCQNFNQDMAKMKAFFEDDKGFSANVQVKYYKKNTDQAPAQIKTGLVKRWKKYYYSKFEGKEYLANANYSVLADWDKKIMIISLPIDEKKQNKVFSTPEVNEKTINNNITRKVEGQNIMYAIASKDNNSKGTILELDQNGERLIKIIYYGGNSYGKIEIIYSYPITPISFEKSIFSESMFFIKKNNSFFPIGKYLSFEIYDQTKTSL